MILCYSYVIFALTLLYKLFRVEGESLSLTEKNIDDILGKYEIVFINFSADWCRFSQMLAPTWDETAEDVQQKVFPTTVLLAKVNCDTEQPLCQRFHVSKYPTMKLLKNGQITKKEYRGQRSKDSFIKYLEEVTVDPVKEYESLEDFKKTDKKAMVIGYFDKKEGAVLDTFRKLARALSDDCSFIAGFGDIVKHLRPDEDVIVFRKPNSMDEEVITIPHTQYNDLRDYIQTRCVPLVREITFENAEELTEEGLPFLIHFHKSDDVDSPKTFQRVIETSLLSQKGNINFLVADGHKFSHPLHHLGKSLDDLPLIAIDSFRHMYLFSSYADIEKPGKLLQFVTDLNTGKLHREFHYGPDPTQDVNQDNGDDSDDGENSEKPKPPTSPPESAFKNLGPSDKRYTLLNRDEL